MKVLIVKTSSMGDIIHALPVAYDMAQAIPGVEIHWAVEESFKDIPLLSPFVAKTKICAFRRWRKNLLKSSVRQEIAQFRQDLVSEHYDAVVDIQGLIRSALLASWTRRPVTGYSRKAARESLAALLYTYYLPYSAEIPAVLRYRLAVADALKYSFDATQTHFGLIAKARPSIQVDQPFAAFAVNTSRDNKLWDESNWVEVGNRLLQDKGLISVLFWGNSTEQERCERLAQQIQGAIVAPRTDLLSTSALIAQAKLVLGVDTGLTHLGAALGLPSVGIFVSTPLDRVALVGEGPVESLGDNPDVQSVYQCIEKVLTAGVNS